MATTDVRVMTSDELRREVISLRRKLRDVEMDRDMAQLEASELLDRYEPEEPSDDEESPDTGDSGGDVPDREGSHLPG